jgi:DNA-binding response OmpR family regulator
VFVHVLLVEDDDGVALPLAEGLRRDGHLVDRARDAGEAMALFLDQPPEMILLDLGLPDRDGLEVCREIRRTSRVPLIVITARDTEENRVDGLELGADDYVVKPFGLRELAARMRAVARRSGTEVAVPDRTELHRGASVLRIEHRTGQIFADGVLVELTPKERDLLLLLADDPGRLYARREILERVWSPNWYGPTKTLDVHVASLRRKIGDPNWVETVRSVGYRLAPDEERVDTTG